MIKKCRIGAFAAAFLLIGGGITSAKSPKRGVSENSFTYMAQIEALSPGVTWFYNWGNSFGTNLNDKDMEFVPMTWSGSYNADRIREFVKANPKTKYLLGFNEPNFSNQANMTPQVAAAAWPAVRALADELGLKLVAPAMNYSPNAPYQSPTKWFDEFVELVGNDAFDYVAIHSYGGLGNIQELATTFHDRYGKDVWLTEFCLWPGESQSTYISPATQIASMVQCVSWLEKTPWIFRYAWFKPVGQYASTSGPNYSLLIPGKGEDPRELSEQGKVYCYMPDFDPEVYNPVNELIPARDLIALNGLVFGSNNDGEVNCPIEITQFTSGSYADYQFDVPAAGNYQLALRVAGVGEPVRFNPTIEVRAVNPDETAGDVLCAARSFDLSGNDETYQYVSFPLTLSAGKQTLRVKECGLPSGIRISGLVLTDGEFDTAIEEISLGDAAANDAVYDLRGVCVNPASLPAHGIYIRNGVKIIR